MFIVRKRSVLLRFALFLGLAGLMATYVAGKFSVWRTSDESAGESAPALMPERAPVTEEKDFFAAYRLERDQRRGALTERLKEVMESESADVETRRQATREYLNEGRLANLEQRAEAMVKARGFEDVVVDLAEGSLRVVVKSASLSQQQFVQIMETVSQVTGVKPSSIQVISRSR